MKLFTHLIIILCFQTINKLIPIRATLLRELLGADYVEHNILHGGIGIENAVEVLQNFHDNISTDINKTGYNIGNAIYLENNFADGFENRPQTMQKMDLTAVTHTMNLIFDQNMSESEVENVVKNTIPDAERKANLTTGRGAYGRM